MLKKATEKDLAILTELALKMWNGHTFSEMEAEFRETLSSENAVCFIKFKDSVPAGFAQCSLRSDYVEGTHSSPVGYLEGIFICEEFRNRGFAKDLLCACENWAKEKGCSEFASDCELTNSVSADLHLATGFTEANRIICFKKELI